MKISWEWLNSLVDLTGKSPENLSTHLTLAGCEIEEIKEVEALGAKDYVLDITSTPNRSDLQGMVGIAKEICGILNIKQESIFQMAENIITETSQISTIHYDNNSSQIAIPTNYCSISNLTQVSTPTQIKKRLETSGIKVENNVNDIGNYMMLKWGHPIEIVDLSKINTIEKDDITFVKEKKDTGKEIVLTRFHNKTVGLTGIQTDESYKAKKNSDNICIQTNIIPIDIVRKNSKYSNIRNEFSIRYERGLNTENLKLALLDTILLIKNIYPEVLVGSIYNNIIKRSTLQDLPIKLNIHKVRKTLGKVEIDGKMEDISLKQIKHVLLSLGCSVKNSDYSFEVTVPISRKSDLLREIDLIEEIARIQGFNSFKDTLPQFKNLYKISYRDHVVKEFGKKMRSLGMTEVVHYSLTSHKKQDGVRLENPIMIEYNGLRTNLICSLVDSFKNNLKTGEAYCESFEIGRVFSSNTATDSPLEKEMIAGIFGGRQIRTSWQSPLRVMEWFEAKGIIEAIIYNISKNIEWKPMINEEYKNLLHPNRSASLYLEDTCIGTFGEIHPQIMKQEGLPHHTYCFELELAMLIKKLILTTNNTHEFQNYSPFPCIIRDISITIPVDTTFKAVIHIIKQQDHSILRDVQLFDEYKGKNIDENKRSIALRIIYQSNSKTLTTNTVDEIHEKLKDTIKNKLNVEFR
nr:SyfB [Erythrotrichia foliiformis]